MTAHVVVWDIETVPDLRGYAAANGHHGKSDDEIREADARGRWRAHARGLVGARGRMTLVGLNFVPRDRQKAPEIAPLFNAFQRAGPRPENSFPYLLGHIDLASIRASSAP
jgi:hypothetical protein